MKDPVYERLREANWRRKLTISEEAELRAWLVAHPEVADRWESEVELTDALERLSDAPVPTNFTARVLAQAQREGRATDTARRRWIWHGRLWWLPRLALASVVVVAGVVSFQHAKDSRRQERAESVREFVSFVAVSGPELLEDYDAIRAMGQSPRADVELLNALQ